MSNTINLQSKILLAHSIKKKIDKIYRAPTLFLILDMRPFALVKGEGFRNFLKVIDARFDLPSRKVFRQKYFPDIVNEVKNEVRAIILTNALTCNVTCDFWTCSASQNAYFTLTCHLITQDF